MECQGIYLLRNLSNGKRYIGSSKDIHNRINQHLYSLRRGNHFNPHLQRSFNRYGENNFKFFVIEKVKKFSQLYIREQYYCDVLKPEYNKRLKVDTNNGLKRKMEDSQKIEISIGMRKVSDEMIDEIRKMNLDGCRNMEIALYFNIDKSVVSRIINNRRRYSKSREDNGDRSGNKKIKKIITESDRKIVVELKNNGFTNTYIAKRFGVDISTISKMITRLKQAI